MNRIDEWKTNYARDGFVAPIDVLSPSEARDHRRALEDAERRIGAAHYLSKIHTILRSPHQLATHPRILDLVEAILGRDILLHNTTYIIKEPQSSAHVSWHQDLTYWGFDSDEQVSVWLALSRADEQSGCMKMIPGSHRQGQLEHALHPDDHDNVLLQGQTVHDVDEQRAVACALQPGQASFHHGWTLHTSRANQSDDRRIGLNIQYIAPHVRQTKRPGFSALLVRGEDRFHYYENETPATRDCDPQAMAWRAQQDELYVQIAGSA